MASTVTSAAFNRSRDFKLGLLDVADYEDDDLAFELMLLSHIELQHPTNEEFFRVFRMAGGF